MNDRFTNAPTQVLVWNVIAGWRTRFTSASVSARLRGSLSVAQVAATMYLLTRRGLLVEIEQSRGPKLYRVSPEVVALASARDAEMGSES